MMFRLKIILLMGIKLNGIVMIDLMVIKFVKLNGYSNDCGKILFN